MPTSDRPRRLPRREWFALTLVAVVSASCSKNNRPPVFPVQGTVTSQKRPATGAVVILRPVGASASGEVRPHGEVDLEGRFRIGTYETADGAPAGEYTVTITWPESKTDPGGGEVVSGDRLKGKYSDPAKSRWKVTIKDGVNALEPFLLD